MTSLENLEISFFPHGKLFGVVVCLRSLDACPIFTMDISKWKDLWKPSVVRISPKTLVAQPLIHLHGFSAHRSMVNLSDLKNKSFSFAGMVGDQASSSSVSYNSMLNFGSRL